MTTDEKFAALKALTPTHLEMRKPGDWYVRACSRECGDGAMLVSHYGNGTPQEAIEDDWRQISAHPRVIINVMGKDRREVFWNGYMWRGKE